MTFGTWTGRSLAALAMIAGLFSPARESAGAPEAAGLVDAAMIRETLDPAHYIGQSIELALAMVEPARTAARRLRACAASPTEMPEAGDRR